MTLLESIYIGSRFAVQEAVARGEDPSMDNNSPVRIICEMGDHVVLKELLKSDCVDPSVNDNYPIRVAASMEREVVVKVLLKDKRINYSDVMDCSYGKSSRIKEFIQRCKTELRDEVIDSVF